MIRNRSLKGKQALYALLRWRPGSLARAGLELTGWLFLRAAAQAIAVLLLARMLGANDYGAFVAVLAIATISASLAGLGLPSVLLRDGSRQPDQLCAMLGRGLSIWWRSVLVFTVLSSLIAKVALPPIDAPEAAILGTILAEIASISLVELLGRAFQARHNTRAYGLLLAGLPLARMTVLTVLWIWNIHDLRTWLYSYIAVSIVYSIFAARMTQIHIGWEPSSGRLWAMIREGIPFTSGAVSARLQGEYNKPLLAQAAFEHAGQFNIAQRAVDLISLPILALQEALWPRLYSDSDYRRRLIVAGSVLTAMSLIGAAFVFATAGLIPILLGEEFRPTSELMVWLALLPFFSVLRNIGNFQLIATHRTHMLTWAYLSAGFSGVLFSTLLIPAHGMLGAVWAAYLTESSALVVIVTLLKINRQPNAPHS